MTFAPAVAAIAALTASIFLTTPGHADRIKSGSAPQSTKETTKPPVKGIDSPGGQSTGPKSAPFNPVTVTFPKTTPKTNPATPRTTGGSESRGGGHRR